MLNVCGRESLAVIRHAVALQIGLAVGDIEAIQRDAILKRIAMQVSFPPNAYVLF